MMEEAKQILDRDLAEFKKPGPPCDIYGYEIGGNLNVWNDPLASGRRQERERERLYFKEEDERTIGKAGIEARERRNRKTRLEAVYNEE